MSIYLTFYRELDGRLNIRKLSKIGASPATVKWFQSYFIGHNPDRAYCLIPHFFSSYYT
jgi:hypothetical protein